LVKIRLTRTGSKKQPNYRIVAADSKSPRDGKFLEIIGRYDPLTDPETVIINEEKALVWLKNGAQPTKPVERLLNKTGILGKFKG
jgi:small subunit ribosomal protein S16